MASEHDDRVREKAYHLWREGGGEQGKDMEHWLRAEREVSGEAKPSADIAATKPAGTAKPKAAAKASQPSASTKKAPPAKAASPKASGKSAPSRTGKGAA